MTLSAPGPHAFLLVTPLGRYTESENQAAREMLRVFGETALRCHTVVLFTRGDDLEESGIGIEEFLGQDEAPEMLKALVQTCGGRYHVLNNKEPENRTQVKTLIQKVEKMVEENKGRFYTSTMFQQAELVIQEEEDRLMRERAEGEGEEERADMELGLTKKRRMDLEVGLREREVEERHNEERRNRGGLSGLWSLKEQGEKWRESRRGSRRHSSHLAVSRFRRKAALSQKVLDQVKVLVAAGATGMAVGAVFGAAAPLAMVAGASMVGNSMGLVGVSVAGSGVSKALGAIVAAATGKTVVAVGAATGGVVGGSLGALIGAEAESPRAAALEALGQVGTVGATVVGVAAGVGGALGAGTVMGAMLEGGAALTGAEAAAGGAVSVANATTMATGSLGSTMQAVGGAVATPQAMATGGAVGNAMQAVGGASCSTSSGVMGALNTAGTTARIITAVTEIGKAAAGIVVAGGLVVKVVKEKVRSATENTERHSYEIYWNK